MNDRETGNKERAEKCKQAIRDYISDKNRHGEMIKSRISIYRDLDEKDLLEGMAASTVYRYLQDMGYGKTTTGYCVLNETATPFAEILEYRRYNKTLYFHIADPSYGPILEDKINNYYGGYENSFHCVAIGDMLICFYYYKKDQNGKKAVGSLTMNEIKKDIGIVANQYAVTFLE